MTYNVFSGTLNLTQLQKVCHTKRKYRMSVCDIKLSKHLIDFDLVLSVQDIRAVLTYASLYEALRAARHLTPCKISLQWAWFGFKMTTEADTMLYDNG